MNGRSDANAALFDSLRKREETKEKGGNEEEVKEKRISSLISHWSQKKIKTKK